MNINPSMAEALLNAGLITKEKIEEGRKLEEINENTKKHNEDDVKEKQPEKITEDSSKEFTSKDLYEYGYNVPVKNMARSIRQCVKMSNSKTYIPPENNKDSAKIEDNVTLSDSIKIDTPESFSVNENISLVDNMEICVMQPSKQSKIIEIESLNNFKEVVDTIDITKQVENVDLKAIDIDKSDKEKWFTISSKKLHSNNSDPELKCKVVKKSNLMKKEEIKDEIKKSKVSFKPFLLESLKVEVIRHKPIRVNKTQLVEVEIDCSTLKSSIKKAPVLFLDDMM